MIKKDKSLFIIFALFSIFVMSIGLFFIFNKNDNNETNQTNATDIYANLYFYIRCSDTYFSPEYTDTTIIGEDSSNYNPYSSTPTVAITATCSEDLYMNGAYMGDNNGSHTITYSISNGTSIVIQAHRWAVFDIGTFNISLSINSKENDYTLYDLSDSSASTSLSLGGAGRTVSFSYYLYYKPDYWKGTFYSNDGSSEPFANITQTNYRYWDLPLENPTREGYIFDGWYTSSTSGTKITNTTLFKYSGSQNIYAHWTKNYHYKVRTDVSGNGYTSPYIISVTNPNNYYPFTLNSSGYYESTNKGVNNSYSLCKVSFYVHVKCNVSFTVINYAESNYDFGIFSNLDTTLTPSYSVDSDNVYKSFKGSSSSSSQTLTYNNVSAGSHYIYVKFRKDSSNSSNNDSLKFKFSGSGYQNFSNAGFSNIYPFTLNSDGYYESTNKGVNNSYSMCKLSFYVPTTMSLNFSVINYAENGYDFAIFSNLDTALVSSGIDTSNVFKSFEKLSSSSVQTVTYTNVSAGTHYIYVKFRKDVSNHSNNDSVKFKLKEETDTTICTYDEYIYQANPSKTGYSFAGWTATNLDTSTAKTGTSSSNINTSWTNGGTKVKNTYFKNLNSDMGTVTLKANYSANGYSLVADLNEPNTGTFLNKVKWTLPSGWSTAGDKSYASKGTLPTPSREGYTFKGWYDTSSSSGGTKVSSSTIMKAGVCGWSTSSQKATIYARWTVNSYTITFNKNSGTNGTNSVIATYDKAMPSITIPKRTGYSFAGYYDKEQDDYGAGAGGTQYYNADGTSARLWDKDANTTLYARWLPRTDYQVDINILSPSGAQDYQSGTMTQTYGSQTFTGSDQGFNNITFKESWTISNIVPTNGMVLTSVSANAGTLVDNGNGTYTFTANFNNDPSGTWDAVITIQMGDTWAMYAQTPTNGTGSASSPYIIDTPGKLAWISSQLLNNSKGLHYKQTKPIDMSGHYWYPIGASGRTFTGNYNGQGYAIINLYTSPNMIVEGGLFGYVESGIIENVVILSADIQGGSDIGIIAGINNGGTIRNCYVEGNVTATERGVSSNKYSIGGIVGYAPNGTVSSSYYKGLLRGTENRWYGLMIGYGENATLNDSIGETSSDTAYYNNTVSVDSCLYTYQKQSVIAKRYYAGTFRNWVVSSGRALPTGLTWIGTAGDKVTSISQIQALGYSSM